MFTCCNEGIMSFRLEKNSHSNQHNTNTNTNQLLASRINNLMTWGFCVRCAIVSVETDAIWHMYEGIIAIA